MFELVKIGSPTCTPCLILDEDFEQVEEKFPSIKIRKIDLNDEIIKEYSVEKIPLLILYNSKQEEESRLQSGDISKVLNWLSIRFIDANDEF